MKSSRVARLSRAMRCGRGISTFERPEPNQLGTSKNSNRLRLEFFFAGTISRPLARVPILHDPRDISRQTLPRHGEPLHLLDFPPSRRRIVVPIHVPVTKLHG